MKHSKQVPLILLGAVTAITGGVTGCGRSSNLPDSARQNTYSSAADCRKDWGDGDWCGASGSHGSVVYAGPRYYWDRNDGRPMVIENGQARALTSGEATRGALMHATGVESVAVARGGFGSTAHGGGGHGSGGG